MSQKFQWKYYNKQRQETKFLANSEKTFQSHSLTVEEPKPNIWIEKRNRTKKLNSHDAWKMLIVKKCEIDGKTYAANGNNVSMKTTEKTISH